MIVPQEIRNREFKRSFSGYDDEEVALFLQRLADEFEELYSEREKLKEHLRRVQNQIEVFKKSETGLDQILELAHRKYAELEKQAEKENRILLDEVCQQVNHTLESYRELIQRLNTISREVKLLLQEDRHFYEAAAGLPVVGDQEGVDLPREAEQIAAHGKELLKSLEECDAFIGEYVPAESRPITIQSLMSALGGETAELSSGDGAPMSAALKEISAGKREEAFCEPALGAADLPGEEGIMAKPEEAARVEREDNEPRAEAGGEGASLVTDVGTAAGWRVEETAAESEIDGLMESAVEKEVRLATPAVKQQAQPSLEIPWEMPGVGRRKKRISDRFGYTFILILVVILGLVGGYCWRHGLIPHLTGGEAGGGARKPAVQNNGVAGETADNEGSSGAILLQAVVDQDPEKIRELLDNGVSPDVAGQNGETPLMVSAYLGDEEVTRLLLEAGADPDKKEPEWGNTALMYASFQGHLEVVEMLLDYKADPNISNREGWTALMCAAYAGRPKTVQALIRGGADADKATNDGWTAYELAMAGERQLTINAMKNEGVKPTTRDISGREPDVSPEMLKLKLLEGER
ncbi:MAG: DivIVA domain-containing protein [Syntrophomonadaceae bacterium]|nr:DivIVA domain-containing protein [Syntrophomonadaceae bacterium]